VAPVIEQRRIVTSFIQHLPGAARGYRRYLPLFPRAAESLNLSAYDLVISTSHCAIKGVRPRRGALHLCYCHTPMRYVWDQFPAYFGPGRAAWPTRLAAHLARRPLQRWDVRSSARVHRFYSNSENVRQRIRRYYARDAEVIHPPVDCSAFTPDPRGPEDYFLVVSALSGYKRVDLAIAACARAGARLIVNGTGPDLPRLRRLAAGARVEFVGWQSPEALARLYARSRALLFPGVEDFGIAPLESMAAGRPVIAHAAGGALETVVDGRTGVLVHSSDVDAWATALRRFDPDAFDPHALRTHAERFDRPRYRDRMRQAIARDWAAHARAST
jgi:glycosyltransferase involved in cell wall biosynthesis